MFKNTVVYHAWLMGTSTHSLLREITVAQFFAKIVC